MQTIRQTWGFFIVSLKSQLRSPSAIFFGLFFPVIFIVIFGFFSNTGSNIKADLGLVPETGQTYQTLKNALEKTNLFDIQEGSKEFLEQELEKGQIDGYAQLRGNQLDVFINQSRPSQANLITQGISTVSDKLTIQSSQVLPLFSVNINSMSSRSNRYIDFVLPGIVGFSLISSVVSGTSFSFITLRKTQALKRLFATPAKPSNFILGQAGSRLFFNFIQSTVLFAIAMLFFAYSPRGGTLGLLQMSLVVILGLICFLGIGYIVAGLTKTEDQAAPVSQIITLPQILLAGTFFPVDNLPQWLQTIARALPLYNFNEALRLISLDGLTLISPQVALQVFALIVWSVIFYFIASRVFNVKAY